MLKLLFHLALIPANFQEKQRPIELFFLDRNLDDAPTEKMLTILHIMLTRFMLSVLLIWFNVFPLTQQTRT